MEFILREVEGLKPSLPLLEKIYFTIANFFNCIFIKMIFKAFLTVIPPAIGVILLLITLLLIISLILMIYFFVKFNRTPNKKYKKTSLILSILNIFLWFLPLRLILGDLRVFGITKILILQLSIPVAIIFLSIFIIYRIRKVNN